jgi:thioredoxin reductase (NADPH)
MVGEEVMEERKVIIIGGGCSGLTAAIYTSRAGLSPLVISGLTGGGQLTKTTEVENFPGFPDGVMGPELVSNMRKQAEKFGAEFLDTDVTRVDFSSRPFLIVAGDREYRAHSVIVATGADARMIGLESEKRLVGHGVSTCATCDGFFYRGKEIAVVGGGDSALEEANFLTKFASKVTIIHRRDSFRASKAMQEKVFKNEKIEYAWDSVVTEVLDEGTGLVTGVKLKNVKTGEESILKIEGLFVAIGHVPNTKVFEGQLELDEHGFIVSKGLDTHTSVEGVFVCGDVYDKRYRQAITAAGMGCKAALDAERFLEEA